MTERVQLQNRRRNDDNRKKTIVKIAIMLFLLLIVLIIATIAWFAVNRDVGANGMGVNVTGMPFELRTSGSAGLYDDYISRIDNGYTNDSQTGSSSAKITLQLTNSNQMENLWQKNTPPSQNDLDSIKRIESTEYGLNPGDHGTLSFYIVPNQGVTGSFNVHIKPVISCYKTEYYTTDDVGYTAGYQKDVITAMDTTDALESAAILYTNTHISLYYMADEDDDGTEEMHLIPEDGFTISNIDSETEVVIYWFWPDELSDILELDIEDMDETGASELRRAFFASPDDYLEKVNDSDDFSDIVISADGTESDRDIQSQSILESPTTYNFYSNRYNNADQTIGDKVGYIMVEIVAE